MLSPTAQPQKSGAGTNHQLVENGWVIGFFMDGASAQIPIVLGSIGDENPDGVYGTTDDGSPFPQLVPPAYQRECMEPQDPCHQELVLL